MVDAGRTPEELAIEGAAADARFWSSYKEAAPFPREEIEEALDDYGRRFNSGDMVHWCDILTPDVLYVDGHFGTFRGREAVRDWVVPLSQGQTDLKFVSAWHQIQGNIVINFNWGRYPNPNGSFEPYDDWRKPGGALDQYEYQFQNLSILVYGGDGMFRYEQDFYSAEAYAGITRRWMERMGRSEA